MIKNGNSKPESQALLGMVPVTRASMEILQTRGIEAETLGLHRMSNGSALITLETVQDVKEKLRQEILKDDGSDSTSLPALANALANIVKSETALFKVLGGIPNAQAQQKQRGKSFAPAAPIDVQAKAKSG